MQSSNSHVTLVGNLFGIENLALLNLFGVAGAHTEQPHLWAVPLADVGLGRNLLHLPKLDHRHINLSLKLVGDEGQERWELIILMDKSLFSR
jgi:hypothetical protein